MAIDVTCPSCDAKYRVKDELAGRTAKCTKCGSAINIPAPAAADEDAAASDDEYRLADANRPGDVASPTELDAAASSDRGEKCPICGVLLMPDAVMCMSCGFEFDEQSGSDAAKEDNEESPEKLSEREEELIAELPVATAARVTSSVAPYLLVTVALAMIGLIAWWGYGLIAKWQSHRRIDVLVDSVMEGKPPTGLAAELAKDLSYLPDYLSPLSSRAQRSKQNNLDIQGLEFVEGPTIPHYQVRYSNRLIELGSTFTEDVPEPWRESAAISTLIVNLPAGCDLSPLLTVRSEYFLPAVLWTVRTNTDLDWQVQKSCDPDDHVRDIAAQVLVKTLNISDPNSSAHDSLSERTTAEEKQAIVDRLKESSKPVVQPDM